MGFGLILVDLRSPVVFRLSIPELEAAMGLERVRDMVNGRTCRPGRPTDGEYVEPDVYVAEESLSCEKAPCRLHDFYLLREVHAIEWAVKVRRSGRADFDDDEFPRFWIKGDNVEFALRIGDITGENTQAGLYEVIRGGAF